VLAAPLLLAACDSMKEWAQEWRAVPPGVGGRELRAAAPPQSLNDNGGASGALIGGGREIHVPADLVNNSVGSEIGRWLSLPERQALADASQKAATGVRNTRLAWSATAPTGDVTAEGWIAPVSDPYRSSHGQICRDVRQALVRNEQAMAQELSLCREELVSGATVWTIPHWP
jgi:surface antigen